MSFSRRNFLKCGLMTGASVALTACQRNVEHKLVSQYQMPEYQLPGQALHWATACGECAGGCGVAAKTTDGRVIKLDGLPEHPLSRGGICARGQSALQVAYHPNRLNQFTDGKGARKELSWEDFFKENLATDKLAGSKPIFVTRHLQGHLGGLMVELARQHGGRIWVVDYPSRWAERQVMKALTGKAELPHYRLEEADYVVTFGGDLLNLGHNGVLLSWGYGQFRQGQGRDRGTLVSVASRINMTGASADLWLPVRPGTEGWAALGVGNLIAAKKGGSWPAWAKQVSLAEVASQTGLSEDKLEKLAARLMEAKKPLVVADSDAGNYINGVDSVYIVHALNKLLRGTIETFEPENVLGVQGGVPAGLLVNTAGALKLLDAGDCGNLWFFDVDVARLMPAGVKLADAIGKASRKIAFATFASDTTALCDLVVPVQSWLEDWGSQRISGAVGEAFNLQQPVITSLWDQARSLGDILMAAKVQDPIALGVVAPNAPAGAAKGKTFRDFIQGDAKDSRWETMLARGGAYAAVKVDWDPYPHRISSPPPLVADPGSPPAGVNPYDSIEAAQVSSWGNLKTTGLVLVPYATLALRDGSLGNRPWMQELPDPITTVVWGGWIEISKAVAEELHVERHDLISVKLEGVEEPIVGPALPLPSLHPEVVAIPVGDEKPDYSKWSDPNYVDFGKGNMIFGRYGYTNANYGKGGINPLRRVPAQMTAAGEPRWAGHKVVEISKVGKTEMITAMDLRVFNLPREVIPFQ